MLFARRFEERCYEAYVERNIGGFLHLYPGEEACAHGVLEAARVGHDYVITSYVTMCMPSRPARTRAR